MHRFGIYVTSLLAVASALACAHEAPTRPAGIVIPSPSPSRAATAGSAARTTRPTTAVSTVEIEGCWVILTSDDRQFPVGDTVCLHQNAISSRGWSDDAWPVRWSRTDAGWIAVVAAADTQGARVEHIVTRYDAGTLLEFHAASGSPHLQLGTRRPLDDAAAAALERAKICRACMEGALRGTQAAQDAAIPLYSLRLCRMFAHTLDNRCSDL